MTKVPINRQLFMHTNTADACTNTQGTIISSVSADKPNVETEMTYGNNIALSTNRLKNQRKETQ